MAWSTIFGRDPRTGFARRPHDNVGVQYGLGALNSGEITTDVFLDMNEKVGGYDIDTKWQPERTVGDLDAIRIAYESGMTMTGGGGLKDTPIIDVRSYTDPSGDFHESYHSFKARARLIKAQRPCRQPGHAAGRGRVVQPRSAEAVDADGQVAGCDRRGHVEPAPCTESGSCQAGRSSRRMLDERRPVHCRSGRVRHRTSECNPLYPPHSAPRLEAGAPLADDVWKCQLKPIEPRDYKVTFTEAEKARLQKIFPTGVCDWSKPGLNQKPVTEVWRRY